MKGPTITTGLAYLLRLAYHPGRNPKKPLPGPLYDVTVVGLLVFFAIGYALS
jgi:hypothetical protein